MDKQKKKELLKKYRKAQKQEFNSKLPFSRDLFENIIYNFYNYNFYIDHEQGACM